MSKYFIVQNVPILFHYVKNPDMENPYLKLPPISLDLILKERNITFDGTTEQKQKLLLELDRTNPEWDFVFPEYFENIEDMSLGALYHYGIYSGVTYPEETQLFDITELRDYTKVSLLLNNLDYSDSIEILSETLRDTSFNVVKIISKRFNIDPIYLRFLDLVNPSDLKEELKRNNINYIINNKVISKCVEKYKKINKDNFIKKLILNLYSDMEIEAIDPIVIISSLEEPHELEDIVLNLKSTDKVIKKLHIVIPPAYKSNPKKYIYKNIKEYIKVFERRQSEDYSGPINYEDLIILEDEEFLLYIEEMHDLELFSTFGFMFSYYSRKELINNILKSRSQNSFMLPYKESSHIPIKLTGDKFFICYGKLNKFNTYNIEEIFKSFSESNSLLMPNKKELFGQDISALIDLLKVLSDRNVQIASKTIDTIIKIHKDKEEKYIKLINSDFNKLNKESKQTIKQILIKIFSLAKAVKKFKPRETPIRFTYTNLNLNLKEKYLKSKSLNLKINKLKHEIEKIINGMNKEEKILFMNLRIFIYNLSVNTYFLEHQTLFSEFSSLNTQVNNKEISKKIISTSKYHLEILFKYKII